MKIVEIPETTSYFWKLNRKITYSNWPFNDSDKCNAERMAAAGFYVIGRNESDLLLVECFMCEKQLRGWKSDDDPWSKHMKYQLICPFVKLNRQDENKWTMKELYYLSEMYEMKEYKDKIKKDLAKLKDETDRLNMRKLPLYKLLNKKDKRSGSY
ncbi:PREDICTED: baculoviral IAP repeat-containing protein 5-like [Wasmannia auropunctata]|uniref:baculoviral IAP repeat-containing protein 5-like n=1 Tax=Wasmannia auropunctata TaxID=64793 RepID=UPI0005EEE54F|nr:PREDICTED: baculoviral IAP repeat-containing protein 5-like [Wasmannia auropunctata]